jgi:imidazolonepropionase-like amidohydrolase
MRRSRPRDFRSSGLLVAEVLMRGLCSVMLRSRGRQALHMSYVIAAFGAALSLLLGGLVHQIESRANTAGGQAGQRSRSGDLAINNARILDGTGRVIERGSILIADGRIAAITDAPQDALRTIDAAGTTAMPGLIDTHVHLITGPAPKSYACDAVIDHLDESMRNLLRRGFTTVLSPGDPFPAITALKQRISERVVDGPRLLVVGPAFSAPDHPGGRRPNFCDQKISTTSVDTVRREVGRLVDANVDGIKVIFDSLWPPKPRDETVAAIADEADARELPVMAHVQSVDDALQAVALGVNRLVHLPWSGSLTADAVAMLRSRAVAVSSTVHLWAPIHGPGSMKTNHGGRQYSAEQLEVAELQLAAALSHLRALWRGGVPVAFGTDTYRGADPSHDAISHEIEALSRVLTPSELVAALTRNGAVFLGLERETGTLEVGKRADVAVLSGNPISDIRNLGNVKMVIKNGEVLVDVR